MIMRAIEDRFVTLGQTSALKPIVVLVSLCALLFSGVAVASAAKPTMAPGWEVDSHAFPTNLKPGGTGIVVVDVYNIGEGSSEGGVTVVDKLPAGLEAVETQSLGPYGWVAAGAEEVEFYEEEDATYEKLVETGKIFSGAERLRVWNCTGTASVECTNGIGYQGVQRPMPPGYIGRIGIAVKVTGSSGVEQNHVSISGGGAPVAAESSDPITIAPAPAHFGVFGFGGWFSNADGTIDTQAGSHPYSLTINFGMNAIKGGPTGGALRDVSIALPSGLVGNPHAVPQCTRQQFMSSIEGGCPPDTQVGLDWATIKPSGENDEAGLQLQFPVYNLVPPPGIPAEFGFSALGSLILIDAGVRSGGDYG